MIFSFFQMLLADSLGRCCISLIVLNSSTLRKTFLTICGLGMSVTTSVFAAIFWRFSPEKDVFKIPTILNEVLTDNVFILTTLSLYLFFFNTGFGPVKNTLLCELFTPTEQVHTALNLYRDERRGVQGNTSLSPRELLRVKPKGFSKSEDWYFPVLPESSQGTDGTLLPNSNKNLERH